MKAHLSVVSCATLIVLVSATVSACTGAPSSSVPAIFSPSGTATHSGTGTSKPALAPSGTGTATNPTSTATHTAATSDATAKSQAATVPPPASPTTSKPTTAPASPTTQPATHTQSPSVPQGAPETGGGGTAGLQDGLAIGLGLVAILAGLGSLAYRRRLTRRR